MNRRFKLAAWCTAAALGCGSQAALAEVEWLVAPYLWAADAGLDLTVNDDPVLGASVPFKDIVDKLDSAFMLHVEARAADSRLGFVGDYLSMSLSDTTSRPVGPGGPILGDLTTRTKLDMGFYELAGSFRANQPAGDAAPALDLLLGVRLVDVEQDLTITLPGPGANVIERRLDVSETDLLVGARLQGRFSPKWGYRLRADYATGGTDGTTNLMGAVSYTFGETGLFTLDVGYRLLRMELSGNLQGASSSESEIDLSGPTVGFIFSF
jgi:hypothetical protein